MKSREIELIYDDELYNAGEIRITTCQYHTKDGLMAKRLFFVMNARVPVILNAQPYCVTAYSHYGDGEYIFNLNSVSG